MMSLEPPRQEQPPTETSQPRASRPVAPSNRSALLALAVFSGLLAGVAMTAAFVVFDPFGVLRHDAPGAGAERRPYLANDGRRTALADGTHDADTHAGPMHPDLEGAAADRSLWTCSMHPEVLEHAPGSCPICGMTLTQITAAAAADEPGTVRLEAGVVRRLNVRTAATERRDVDRSIRTVGYLEFDQQRMVTVTTKYQGWIEKVYVANVGAPVRRGQPLFEIYSPELVQTQQELLSALAFSQRMENAPDDARRRANSLVDAARTRLGYWDIGPDLIAKLEATGEVLRTVQIDAPRGGLVMRITPGLEGMAVMPGTETFHIADLSTLWLSVDIFEDQMASIRPGTPATVTFSAFPGESVRGEVRFLEPELAEATRTLRAKIAVPNPRGKLRAGMFATVLLTPTAAADTLAVPREAVLRTGARDLVIVEREAGLYAPQEITVGVEGQAWSQVLAGLQEGDRVVTSAQFLLDSESNLRAAIARLGDRADSAGTDLQDTNLQHLGHQH